MKLKEAKIAFQGRKKLFSGESGYSPGRTLESGYSPGRICSIHFLEKYKSNEAQTKFKTLFKA